MFDGCCNLCSGIVDFLVKHDKKKQFSFVPLQSQQGQQLVEQYKLPVDVDSVIFISGEMVFIESDAAIEIAMLLPFPWKTARVFIFVPRAVRNRIYRFIAARRFRWWGRRQSCRVV